MASRAFKVRRFCHAARGNGGRACHRHMRGGVWCHSVAETFGSHRFTRTGPGDHRWRCPSGRNYLGRAGCCAGRHAGYMCCLSVLASNVHKRWTPLLRCPVLSEKIRRPRGKQTLKSLNGRARRAHQRLFQQHRSKRESALFAQCQLPPAMDMPWILGGARHPSLPVAARWSRPRSRRQRNTWRLTVSLRTQSPSKCPTVYGGGEPLRAADDQWCSEARSVHRVA
jgi:hypothetical protein